MHTNRMKIVSLLAGLAIGLISIFSSGVPAQAATPAAHPVTMAIFNGIDHPTEVIVFNPVTGQFFKKTLASRETWKLSTDYSTTTEISLRTPGDANYLFLGHFELAGGKFHVLDVVHSSIDYILQPTGTAAGFYFSAR